MRIALAPAAFLALLSLGAPVPAAAELTKAPPPATPSPPLEVHVVAKGLAHPWGLAFLPDGRLLVTERPGRLRIITREGRLSEPVPGVPAVYAAGQGGLLDVALSPDFATSKLIYFSYAEPRGGAGRNNTALARARLQLTPGGGGGRLEDVQVIFHQDPPFASSAHFGSRIVFTRDGSLFLTVGERFSARDEAQNPGNHLGKIMRLMPDGSPYTANPKLPGWRPEIWSIGHRNVQGAALHPQTGLLWTIEHGARGGDEINIPEAGKNYGWPVISYGRNYDGTKIGIGTAKKGMEQPRYYWDPSIAPSGAAFYTADLIPAWKGNLFAGALAGQSLHRLVLDGTQVVGEEVLLADRGLRIRDVRQGPDGALWLLTDEDDGQVLRLAPRGRP